MGQFNTCAQVFVFIVFVLIMIVGQGRQFYWAAQQQQIKQWSAKEKLTEKINNSYVK